MQKMAIVLIAGVLMAGSPLMVSPAHADLEVKRSSVPGVKVGAKMGEESQLKVPSGAELELFKLPAGPTYTVKGPYEGTLAGYTNPCPWWKAATGACRKEELDTGGTRGAAEVPGAVRGLRKPTQ
jgi:hypothetical protein